MEPRVLGELLDFAVGHHGADLPLDPGGMVAAVERGDGAGVRASFTEEGVYQGTLACVELAQDRDPQWGVQGLRYRVHGL